MIERNPGCEFDLGWVENTHLNYPAIKKRAAALEQLRPLLNEYRIAWLLKSITLIDLTTLAGDDTDSNVTRLCHKASHPLSEKLTRLYGFQPWGEPDSIHTAAVCVYPAKVKTARTVIDKLQLSGRIQIASVATGFPSGQYPLHTKIEEIKWAVEQGATEIDIVISRELVITGKWRQLYDEIRQMRDACGEAHLKTILAVGELENVENIYKASLVAMMAGSDFIKTSTGKESINATLPVGVVMSRAIMAYYLRSGYKVGLKPAGGIRTAKDALAWLVLVSEELDKTWLCPDLFRFGASGLLGDIEQALYKYATKRYPAPYQFSM